MHLSFGEQVIIGLTLMLTSKGVAAVPRASLVILIATPQQHLTFLFGLLWLYMVLMN
ncbi:MAG: hypothetical protein R2765_07740 [Ferruginibacter sp.]